MKKALVAIGLTTLMLTAGESAPNPYPNGPGFYETRIEANRYRITYRATGRMPRERVENFALLRAAEVTLGQGYEWFRVVGRQGEVDQRNGPRLSLGTGSTSFGRSSAVGLGVGTSFDLSGPPAQTLTLEVVMGKGSQPADRDVYNAADVARTLRSQL